MASRPSRYGGRRELVGVGRLVADPGHEEREFAVLSVAMGEDSTVEVSREL